MEEHGNRNTHDKKRNYLRGSELQERQNDFLSSNLTR